MDIQKTLFYIENKSDIVYTDRKIAKEILDFIRPLGIILDPCRGDGAFYDQIQGLKKYCEIKEGNDFFDFNGKVDFIIGNPPYSIFDKFLEHSFNISDNVSFLVPTNKIFQRLKIMKMINEYGGIKSIIVFGSWTNIGFPFGFSVGNFHFQKKYIGDTKIILKENK